MPGTIETGVREVFPESGRESTLDEQTDTAGPPLTLAAEREALLARLEEIQQLETQQTEEARQAAQAEASQNKPSLAELLTEKAKRAEERDAAAAEIPLPEFVLNPEQIQQLQDRFLLAKKPKPIDRLMFWKKRVSPEQARADQENRLAAFERLVESFPSETRPEGLAIYLANIFDSPEEARSLFEADQKYAGRRWKDVELRFSKLNHIPMETPNPSADKKTAFDHLAWKDARKEKARLRLANIQRNMVEISETLGVDPPMDLLKERSKTRSENEILEDVA